MASTTSVVLDLFRLDLVQQVQRLIEVASVCTAKVGALEESDLTSLCISVLVKQDVELANCISRPDKLLLDKVGVL